MLGRYSASSIGTTRGTYIQVNYPYRWMEDPDAEDTKAFVETQNSITKPYLDKCPHKKELTESLTKLWNFPKFTVPAKHGDYYYFRHNTGLQNQYVSYRKKDLKGEAEVFLDPNLQSDDGTVSLSKSCFSENGTYYCYGLAQSGSDWSTLYVKDCKLNKDLPDKLERFRYSSVSWTIDEKGFFYGQYPDWTGQSLENLPIEYSQFITKARIRFRPNAYAAMCSR